MSDSLTETQFKEAFDLVADQAGIPHDLREELSKELFDTAKGLFKPNGVDDSKKRIAIIEKYISLFDLQWEEGARFMSMYHPKARNPRKRYAELLGNYIISRVYSIRNFERHQRTKQFFSPYLLLQCGVYPCPLHAETEYLVLPVDHPYWTQRPLATSVFCHCYHSPVRLKVLEKYRKEGVSAYDGHVYDENGRPTGQIRKKFFPIKEVPPT